MAGRQTLRLRGGPFAAVLALSLSCFTFAGRASAEPVSAVTACRNAGHELRRHGRERAGAGGDARTDGLPRTHILPECRRGSGRRLASRWVSSTRSSSRSSAMRPPRASGGRSRSATSSARAGSSPGPAAPPGSDGLTPRHGWLGSFEGVFYRLLFVSVNYQNNLNKPFGGNFYRGDFSVFLPFSRRFEMFLNVPYVVANGTQDPSAATGRTSAT